MSRRHFVIVGAQRSGTTYLYELLSAHPDVCMASPFRPEPKYFLEADPASDYGTYLSRFFGDCRESAILGEKSTSYYESAGVAERIESILPQARIIFVLRDPVERALSNYFFSRNNGIETRTIQEVFLQQTPSPEYDLDKISVNPFAYLYRGEYVTFIERYLKVFGGGRVGIFFFEELTENLQSVRELYTFIGADSNYVPACFATRINASQRHKHIPDDVYSVLRQYYEPFNAKLSQLLNRKLPW